MRQKVRIGTKLRWQASRPKHLLLKEKAFGNSAFKLVIRCKTSNFLTGPDYLHHYAIKIDCDVHLLLLAMNTHQRKSFLPIVMINGRL